jgi:hypothetical protein
MRYLALCTDYDGTIAHHGRVDDATLDALERLRESGRKLVMVTGREIPDLEKVFPRFDLFDIVVAENGALLYWPATKAERPLGEAPRADFVEALKGKGVERISVGRSIIATWEPHQNTVLETIREFGLELQVIFNKGAVMILPAGVNKATGLKAALRELNLSVHNAVGVGDAENDHAFLSICECSAAVANALPSVKERADIVLNADHGAGVIELIEEMLANDLEEREPTLARHHILIGTDEDGEQVLLSPFNVNALIVGTSGGGKSSVATGLIERLHASGYNSCIIDPEGDYDNIEPSVVIGGPDHAPTLEECEQLLCKPDTNTVINLLGVKLEDRPWFFTALFPRLRDTRARTGRPHWILVDEVHHMLPAQWQATDAPSPDNLDGVIMVSMKPNLIAPSVLEHVDTIIILGDKPAEMLQQFTEANRLAPVRVPVEAVEKGSAMVWSKSKREAPRVVRVEPSQTERKRHLRKYAEGSLPEDRSFYFRGPQGKLRLRAPNLILFMDLADGVDDETWLFHLKKQEVSEWFRKGIRDESIADEVASIEQQSDIDPHASRQRIRELIEAKYTLPAG